MPSVNSVAEPGTDPLGDESYNTPAICDGHIYLRATKTSPSRQEDLWCLRE
jgi:hypothetical protein